MSEPAHRNALWLVGDDIAHSLSPAMHNAALRALGQPARYTLRPTTRAHLDDTLLEAERVCRGINVTIPYKVDVFERYRATADRDALLVGATNTLVFGDDGAVTAHNTDVDGLIDAWRRASVVVTARSVVVLGAGGAARAAIVAAERAGAKEVRVLARRPSEVQKLHALAEGLGLRTTSVPREPPALLVMATPAVDAAELLFKDVLFHPATVHDLRVRPDPAARNTALSLGHLYFDGTTMLLGQGQRALELFLGEPLSPVAKRAMSDAVASAHR